MRKNQKIINLSNIDDTVKENKIITIASGIDSSFNNNKEKRVDAEKFHIKNTNETFKELEKHFKHYMHDVPTKVFTFIEESINELRVKLYNDPKDYVDQFSEINYLLKLLTTSVKDNKEINSHNHMDVEVDDEDSNNNDYNDDNDDNSNDDDKDDKDDDNNNNDDDDNNDDNNNNDDDNNDTAFTKNQGEEKGRDLASIAEKDNNDASIAHAENNDNISIKKIPRKKNLVLKKDDETFIYPSRPVAYNLGKYMAGKFLTEKNRFE